MKPYTNVRKYKPLGDCDPIIIDGKIVGVRKIDWQHSMPRRLRRALKKADRRRFDV